MFIRTLSCSELTVVTGSDILQYYLGWNLKYCYFVKPWKYQIQLVSEEEKK